MHKVFRLIKPVRSSRPMHLMSVLLLSALGGCVVTPASVRPAYIAPPGIVYVQPTYVSPGPGYHWSYHATYGWGWHHPGYGWHRGWH